MRRPVSTWRIVLVAVLVATTGCTPTQPFYLHEDGDLSHYLDKATQIETPDVELTPIPEVGMAGKPLTISNPDFKEFWDLSLEECISIALANSKILRASASGPRFSIGALQSGGATDTLVESPGAVGSSYNPAIVETNPGQGGGIVPQFLSSGAPNLGGVNTDSGISGARQGVEAALSEFDAQLSITGNPLFSTTDRPRNVTGPISNAFFPAVSRLQNGDFNVELSKRTAEGTLYRLTSLTDSIAGNVQGFNPNGTGTQPLFGVWTQTLQAEVRQPLLQGRGAQINRMPVVLARIGSDVELANLEDQLHDSLNAIEFRYWDLYFQYRNLETAMISRDSALGTWRIVDLRKTKGLESTAAEAQAREQYFNFRAQVESNLRQLQDAENELRFLMGLTATDCRLIRPKDDPTMARVEFDWCDILAEGIARRPELVQQRWRVKQREMELIVFRNELLPRLDIGAQYRWLGVGDQLINANRNGIPFKDDADDTGRGSTAWEELTGGKYQEFSFLLQYQMPIGFRRELAGVRHGQLRLAREKALLEDMELDVSHGLARAVRNLDTNFQLAQTNANRWAAAQQEVESQEALYEGGKIAINDVLESQRRRAIAQLAFWQAVTNYNQAIADLHTRKGSILEYDGICFEEGPWPQKAYWDALALARERDAATYMDYGWTRPKVISRGAKPQLSGETIGVPLMAAPHGAGMEQLPVTEPSAGEPTPATPPVDAGQEEGGTPPKSMPQETRSVPSPAASRAVRQAVYSAESAGSDNPLRGGAQQPFGTGVVNREE